MSSNGYLSKESILALGDKDPEYAEWQKANPEDDEMDWSNIEIARAAVDEWSREQCNLLPDQGILMNIPMRDGYQSSLRIFRPTFSESCPIPSPPSPVIVLIHGGAFCCGDNSNFAAQAVALRALYSATVVLTSYRLVPEHPFPVGQQDIWDSLEWLAKTRKVRWELT
ncbi:Alpha/Beta hydrolase protein [Penicillium chermesinum]|nr:Alpha/Beta hydrolase protein [Penicillium chermesinum]